MCHPFTTCRSPFHTFAVGVLLLTAVSAVSCRRSESVATGVQLVAAQEPLGPGTTFELRFEQPVAAPAQLGRAAEVSPLEIAPKVSGEFVWLSERSGVFTPKDALKLDTAYRFRLVGGLKDAAGRPVTARLDRMVKTPGLEVRLLAPTDLQSSRSNATAVPRLVIEFNSAVEAKNVVGSLRFRRAGGGERRAVVNQATDQVMREWLGWWPPSPTPPWEEQVVAGLPVMPELPTFLPIPPADAVASRPYRNVLCVTPETPLNVGAGWELTIARGLPAVRSGLRLRDDWVLPLGTVQPFAVTGVEGLNALQLGRRLKVTFSKRLNPQVTWENVTNWVSVAPAPEDLSAIVDGDVVLLRGEFELSTPVQVRVKAGLPSDEPFTIERSYTNEVRFEPVPPRVYFASFNGEQRAGGLRQFPLLAVNTTQAVVRAKLIDSDAVVQALHGYDTSHRRGWREPGADEEPYREVPYTLMPGRTVFDRTIAMPSGVDEPREVRLAWDELLGKGRRGVVFLDARRFDPLANQPQEQGVQAVVQLTDLGFVTKSSRDEVVAFAFNLNSGKPVSGALVKLLTEESEVLAQARTDEQGLVRVPQTLRTNTAARFDWRYQSLPGDTREPVGDWLVAQTEDDVRASDLSDIGISASFGERPWLWSAIRERWRMLVFTDRPVYRPGETLQVKVIAREWRNGDWHLPGGQNVKLELSDARGRQVLATNLALGDLASLDRVIKLPAAPLGDYHLQVAGGDASASATFTVQEFKPNAFEVTVTGKPEYRAEEVPEFPISGRYYHGQDLSRAKVVWSLRGDDVINAPASFDDFQFGARVWTSELGYGSGSFAETGSTNLAPGTVLLPEIGMNSGAPQARRCSLLVEVTDLNQQSVSRQIEFLRHSSDFYLGLQLPAELLRAEQSFSPRLAAMRADGEPWPTTVPVKLTLKRVKWTSVRVETAGGGIGYRNDAEILTIAERGATTDELARAGDRWEARGEPRTELRPDEPGSYVLEARATDAAGRPVFSAVQFSVSGADATGWAYRNETQAALVADQPSYVAGQIARVLVKTPLSGPALVTVERERVLRSWVTNLAGGAPVVEVPLVESDAPNVQVSVVQVRGANESPHETKEPEFRAGGVQLIVTRPDRKLAVATVVGAAEYRPGSEVQLATSVTDYTGAAVANAEVTLFAVDEGVLSLTGYTAPDPLAHFTSPRAIEVYTGITLPRLLPEDFEELRYQNKGFLVGGGGNAAGIRRDFRALAFWSAALRTDADGRVSVTFRAPDALTRYRVVTVVHTAGNQFGHREASFTVNKPLMVEPALPKFANVGDCLLARAVVFNRTPSAGEVEVTVALDKLVSVEEGRAGTVTRRLQVPANGVAAVDIPVEFVEAGDAIWVWRARFAGGLASAENGDFTDEVESRWPVGYPVPLLREIHLARVTAGESNLLAQVNPQLVAGRGQTVLCVANTRLGELRPAAEQLIRYPYGCTEQLTSTLLPLLALRQHPALLRGVVTDVSSLDPMIQAGLERLLARQTYNGGFSYWPGGEDEPWVTAYAAVAVSLARAQGFSVPERAQRELMDCLRTQFVTAQMAPSARIVPVADAALETEAQCLALYALALGGRAEAAYHEYMRSRLAELSSSARSWLALAIVEAKGPSALATEVLTSPVALATGSVRRYGSEVSDLGSGLLAWVRLRPDAPEVDRMTAELIQARKDGHWLTTQGNAWAVLGLAAYASAVEREPSTGTGFVSWIGRQSFALGELPETQEFRFAVAGEADRRNLTVAWQGQRPVFTELLIEARPPVWRQPRQERGLAISRHYARLDETNGLRSVEKLRVGDRVLVTLAIQTAVTAYHLAVDDPLPAVLEAVNPAFASQATSVDVLAQDWVSQHRELRHDRVVFFRRELSPGRYVIRYLARVRAAGTATAPAAKIEEMYRPERFGLTETMVLTALPSE